MGESEGDIASRCVADLVQSHARGDQLAGKQLAASLYGELEALARARLARERANHTLEVGDLVGEACRRLMTRARVYEGRSHFLALSAKVLRQVLIDHERKRRADKRDAGQEPLRISHHAVAPGPGLDLADLLERLTELGQRHPRQARVVELRFLSSMTEAEVAEVLGYSERTVRADWRFARAWLAGRLDGRSFE